MEIKNQKDIEKLQKLAIAGWKRFANTEEGQYLLQYLKVLYCEPTCFAETDAKTFGNIANKELVESLIKHSK